mgnify:CR=1 FL=1
MTGLFRAGLVEWMTRDDLPGGIGRRRAAHARAGHADGPSRTRSVAICSADPASAILEIDRDVSTADARRRRCPTEQFGVPARRQPAALDRQGSRQRPEPRRVEGPGREQQDSRARRRTPIPIDGICASRIGAMRCHSQALTIKLTHDVPLAEIESHARRRATSGCASSRTRRRRSLRELTPAAVTGHAECADRPPAQALDGRRISRRVHRRRSAAVGCGRAAAPHAADPARCGKRSRVIRAACSAHPEARRGRERVAARLVPSDSNKSSNDGRTPGVLTGI